MGKAITHQGWHFFALRNESDYRRVGKHPDSGYRVDTESPTLHGKKKIVHSDYLNNQQPAERARPNHEAVAAELLAGGFLTDIIWQKD
jgi:hypothetical protein